MTIELVIHGAVHGLTERTYLECELLTATLPTPCQNGGHTGPDDPADQLGHLRRSKSSPQEQMINQVSLSVCKRLESCSRSWIKRWGSNSFWTRKKEDERGCTVDDCCECCQDGLQDSLSMTFVSEFLWQTRFTWGINSLCT